MSSYSTPDMDPSQSPDSKEQKVNTIWKAVSLIYIMCAIGLIFYWQVNDEGLPMLVCEYQARLFNSDSCYIALNFLLSLLLFLAPLFVVKFIVEKITGVKIHKGK